MDAHAEPVVASRCPERVPLGSPQTPLKVTILCSRRAPTFRFPSQFSIRPNLCFRQLKVVFDSRSVASGHLPLRL